MGIKPRAKKQPLGAKSASLRLWVYPFHAECKVTKMHAKITLLPNRVCFPDTQQAELLKLTCEAEKGLIHEAASEETENRSHIRLSRGVRLETLTG